MIKVYTIYIQVCHDRRTSLEGLRDMVMLLEVKLMSTITVDVYPSMADALIASNKWHSKKLAPNDIASIFISTFFEEKWVITPAGTLCCIVNIGVFSKIVVVVYYTAGFTVDLIDTSYLWYCSVCIVGIVFRLPRNYQSGDYMKGKLTLCRTDNVKKEVSHYYNFCVAYVYLSVCVYVCVSVCGPELSLSGGNIHLNVAVLEL